MAEALERSFPFLTSEQNARLREHGRTRSYDAGTLIVAEGSLPGALFVIESGRAAVEKDHLGIGVQINELRAGDLFGEVSYLDGTPASASVVARTEVSAVVLEDLDELLAQEPALAAGVYRSLAVVLAGRLRYAGDDRVTAGLIWG